MFEGAYRGGSQLPQLSQCGCKRSRGGPRLLAVHPQSVACEMRAAWHTQPHPPPRVCLSLGSVSQGSCIGSWGVVSRRRVWRRMPSVLLAHPVTNAIRVRDGSPTVGLFSVLYAVRLQHTPGAGCGGDVHDLARVQAQCARPRQRQQQRLREARPMGCQRR